MRIAVLGAGAWGTALAGAVAARHDTVLWARSTQQAQDIAGLRSNARYLPGYRLPESLAVVSSLPQALQHAAGGLLLLAVPVASLRPLLGEIRNGAFRGTCGWLCKGLERETGLLAHQVAAAALPGVCCGVLSGPSFAQEVAQGLPTALVAAGSDEFCRTVTAAVHGNFLRVYTSDDLIGVEVGGAVKNVLAIGAGVADALHLGMNARAALITRGLRETRRFGEALGAHGETFTGLTGLGDLILTCTGDLSRNRRIGLALGHGVPLEQALQQIGHVAEGVWSAPAIVARARELGVEMPICETVCDLLAGRVDARGVVERLLARDPRAERN